MIPFSLSWDTLRRSIGFRWNGFLSLAWENGKVLVKILGFPIPFVFRGKKKIHLLRRWVYLKEAFSFLRKWRLKKVEGTLSTSDPMVNGLLYGWASAIETGKVGQKINVTINFLGENWCRGELTISPKILLRHLSRWILFLIQERREKMKRR